MIPCTLNSSSHTSTILPDYVHDSQILVLHSDKLIWGSTDFQRRFGGDIYWTTNGRVVLLIR